MAEQLLEVPKIVLQDQILQGTVEQIFDVPVLEKAEQLVEVPKTVPQDRIQQRTVEQIFDAPVPQAVEELAEVFRVFSQDRIQQRTLEQIIPATSFAEMIVEVPGYPDARKDATGCEHTCSARRQYSRSGYHHPGED